MDVFADSTNPSPEDKEEDEDIHFNLAYLNPIPAPVQYTGQFETPTNSEFHRRRSQHKRNNLESCSSDWYGTSPRKFSPEEDVVSDLQIRKKMKGKQVCPNPQIFLNDEEELDMDETDMTSEGCCKTSVRMFLVLVWLLSTIILTMKKEPNELERMHQISTPRNQIKSYYLLEPPNHDQVRVELMGAFLPSLPDYYANFSVHTLEVWIELIPKNKLHKLNESFSDEHRVNNVKRISEIWIVPTVSEEYLEVVPEIKRQNLFDLDTMTKKERANSVIRVQLKSSLKKSLSLAISCDTKPIKPSDGILYAAILLSGLYTLITFEVINRTLAAVLSALLSIAILANFDERPSSVEIISWIDIETLILLFSMMLLVTIFTESGAFDWLAVLAYKITEGRIWPLINTLCIFTAILSSFLDNVTTVLLMTPVTIKLCEFCELNPSPVLIAMIIYSNIGGGLTIVGDPPNAIIALHPGVADSGVTFVTFSQHMGLALIIIVGYVYFHLRMFVFKDESAFKCTDPHDVQEMKSEIFVWGKTAASIYSPYSKDEVLVRETLEQKKHKLQSELRYKLQSGSFSMMMDNYRTPLQELEDRYRIRNIPLLLKSSVSFLFVILMFFLHSVPELNLSLGWIALLGGVLLLLLSPKEKIEDILKQIEWSTLIFFTALFVLIGAIQKLGLIEWVGDQTEQFILGVDEQHRLTVAISLILWVSALVSSFLDNIPLTSMMVHVITSLSNNKQLNLPIQPLVWALALGASLGGNGTLLGSTANVVCAGVSEQHGYKVTFTQYLKVGYPVMIGTVTVANLYLYVCHVYFTWHPIPTTA